MSLFIGVVVVAIYHGGGKWGHDRRVMVEVMARAVIRAVAVVMIIN